MSPVYVLRITHISITCRFQHMQFPVMTYLLFPLHAVSIPLGLHAVSFTHTFHHYYCYTWILLHPVSFTRAL